MSKTGAFGIKMDLHAKMVIKEYFLQLIITCILTEIHVLHFFTSLADQDFLASIFFYVNYKTYIIRIVP